MINELLQQLKPWLSWMHAHPEWVALATFLIAFIECFAVVGLLVPGTVIMTALGAMIGSHVVPAKIIFISASVGALLGDVVSFLIGRHYHEHLREIWPFKFYPRLLQKGESFFYKHGGKGIFVGRFLGPIRPMLPIIAGMLNMPAWRFFIADITSAIFWPPLYTLPGIILGAASVELAPKVAMHLMLYVILILLIFWCISWLIKKFITWIFKTLHDLLDDIWAAIKHKPFLHPLHVALQDPLHPESHAQLTLGLYFVFIVALFITVMVNIMMHGVLTSWNHPLLFFLRSLHNPIADHIFLMVTLIAEPKVWAGVFVMLLIYFFIIRAYRTATHWGLLGVLAFGGTELLKNIVMSPRPWGLMVIPSGYSFPSGHTALSGAILGFLAVLIARHLKKPYRWIPYTLAPLLVLFVGISRLYLGAHWLTDVIGAMLFAMAIIMFVTLSYRRQDTPVLNPYILLIVFLISWGSVASIYTVKHYQKMQYNYSLYVPAKILSVNTWWQRDGMDEPLYRLSRTGKVTQVLNVQWVGNLQQIQRVLTNQGWVVSPNTTFGAILDRINKQQNKQLSLPVLPQLYLERRPVLIMTKSIGTSDSLLMLTLWDSKTRFNDADYPLWLGNVSYYHIWQTGFFHLHPEKVTLPQQSAIKLLENDLVGYTWKQLSYPLSNQTAFSKLEWDGLRVLVMPKDEEDE